MPVDKSEIILYRGEKKTWIIVVIDTATKLPINITGASIYFTVRSVYPAASLADDSDGEVLMAKTLGSGISISDAVNGEFEILAGKSDTNSIEINAGGKGYLYEISIVESGQSEPRVLALGPFTLMSDIVRGV